MRTRIHTDCARAGTFTGTRLCPVTAAGGDRHGCFVRWFTLVEVLVAAMILAMCVAFTMGLIGGARARILRAEHRWGREHLLAQAAEHYLLAGPYAPFPPGLLPEGFSASCDLSLAGDVPEEATTAIDGWVLGRFHIRVYDTNGAAMAEVMVHAIVREEDCL